MSFSVNSIIDYFGNQEMCLGIVEKHTPDRLHIQGADGSRSKIPLKAVLTTHLPTAGDPLRQLPSLCSDIAGKMGEIDLELLWEALRATGTPGDVQTITRDYFGSDSPVALSAMARRLLTDPVRFQRQGLQFSARSESEIAELETLRQARAERAALRERQKNWLAAMLDPQAPATDGNVPEELQPLLKLIADYLICGFNSDAVNQLAAVAGKMSLREAALRLLKRTGTLPAEADEFLLLNGIHASFPAPVLEQADTITEISANPADWTGRQDYTAQASFSIDDETTLEIDDALAIENGDDDTCTVYVHLADPAHYVGKNDLLDQAAIDRPLSLYLPTTTVTMFPPRLGCDLASLKAGVPRPAITVRVRLNTDGDQLDWELCRSVIRVKKRLTYTEADALMASPSTSGASDLVRLHQLASRLQARREQAGAVMLNRPELRIRVEGEDIQVSVDNQETPSHILVREFMILANHLAACYALRHEIPVIYRTQEAASEPVHSVTPYDPVDFDLQVRKMRKTRLSTYPQGHFGLGLDLYTQVSSPIRRYADLVIQRQLAAHLAGDPLPYTQAELFAVLDNVESTASQNRALEREARRFWIIAYLHKHAAETTLTGTIVRVDGNLVLAELDNFCERGVVITRERLQPGQTVTLKLAEAIPKTGRLAFSLLNHADARPQTVP